MIDEKTLNRFLAKVKVVASGCWEWTGSRDRAKKGEETKPGQGYGTFKYKDKAIKAHRFSWEHLGGNAPPGELCVLHKCDNPKCVNPEHLFIGTQLDNIADKVRKGRGRAVGGEHHWSRLHPEKRATGDRNGRSTCPERTARGDRSGARLHPEKMAKGENHYNAKLTEEKVRSIREMCALPKAERLSQTAIAEMFDIGQSLVSEIVKRKKWKHIS